MFSLVVVGCKSLLPFISLCLTDEKVISLFFAHFVLLYQIEDYVNCRATFDTNDFKQQNTNACTYAHAKRKCQYSTTRHKAL